MFPRRRRTTCSWSTSRRCGRCGLGEEGGLRRGVPAVPGRKLAWPKPVQPARRCSSARRKAPEELHVDRAAPTAGSPPARFRHRRRCVNWWIRADAGRGAPRRSCRISSRCPRSWSTGRRSGVTEVLFGLPDKSVAEVGGYVNGHGGQARRVHLMGRPAMAVSPGGTVDVITAPQITRSDSQACCSWPSHRGADHRHGRQRPDRRRVPKRRGCSPVWVATIVLTLFSIGCTRR